MSLFDAYWPLAVGLVLVAAFGSWVFIHSNRAYLLRWAMIPLSLIVAAASAKLYDARLGYAVATQLPTRFVYLGHQVVLENNHKAGIEVWARSARTRLYRIGYTKPMEQALDGAREKSKSGMPVMMTHVRQAGEASGDKGADSPDDGYESRIVLPSDVNPKDPLRTAGDFR